MTTIRKLASEDTLRDGDAVPFSPAAQGDARKFSLSALVAFLSDAFTSLSVSSHVSTSAVTVALLPSAVTVGAGARAFVTDASVTTFNSALSGGGSNAVPVFSDGSIWRIG